MAEQIITQEYLQSIFEYKDGNLYRIKSTSQSTKIGDVAGYTRPDLYKLVSVKNKQYYLHRLIFLILKGYMPEQIDHIDGNPSNNKIENLRETDYFTNNYNKKIQTNSTSGIKGVNWHKVAKKWRVEVCSNRRTKYLGLYEDLELAELVAMEARNKYHKEFARHL
jgi:hypothetical protein